MAGAKVTIAVDDAEVQALFKRIVAFGENTFRETGGGIGEIILRSTRERADRGKSPDGIEWVELSPKYDKRKARERPDRSMLRFDDFMLGPRLSYDVGPDWVEIGTSAKYGAVQQFGSDKQNIPARPYLGLSDADREAIIADITAAMEASFHD